MKMLESSRMRAMVEMMMTSIMLRWLGVAEGVQSQDLAVPSHRLHRDQTSGLVEQCDPRARRSLRAGMALWQALRGQRALGVWQGRCATGARMQTVK